jgi:hypothetical protein
MRLTDFLIWRQHGLSKNFLLNETNVIFKDVNTSIDFQGWGTLDEGRYDDFVSKYKFPDNSEFSKKDRDDIRENIPKPQVLIQKVENCCRPIIAMYLYVKSQLTGDSVMHIRSINKFEQMWVPYFFTFQGYRRSNPKVIRKDSFQYCQSEDLNFTYSFTEENVNTSARLRILTFSLGDHILMWYVFDREDEKLHQHEIEELINNINTPMP